MNKNEKAVRDAAAAFHDAIVAARQSGLRVEWPATVEGLTSIAVSETAKAEVATTITIDVDGLDPQSPKADQAERAAKKAVDAVVDPPPHK